MTWNEADARGIQFRIDSAHGPTATNEGGAHVDAHRPLGSRADRRGGTRAVYHVQIDFAGSVPRWMVRGGAAKDLPGVFVGMRQLINDHRAGRVGAVTAR